jgi:predicted lipoprotein with Yx(FWY)xxD motif
MSKIRSNVAYGVILVALSSLAVAACGGGGNTKADTSKPQTQAASSGYGGSAPQAASSGYGSSTPVSRTVSVGTSVHVTNTPTKAFRVRPVDTTESVAVGPTGYPIYTFQGETTKHIICQKTASAKTNCWAFWPPVSVSSRSSVSKQSAIAGKLGTFSNQGVLQLTLNGQPLYYFTPDLASKKKTQATGDEIKTFGSIWHVVGTA